MSDELPPFDAQYETGVIFSAARAYCAIRLRQRFMTPFMIGALVSMTIGIAAVLYVNRPGSVTRIAYGIGAFLLAMLAWRIVVFPRILARVLRKHLRERESVSITSGGLSVRDSKVFEPLRWIDVQQVVEYPAYILVIPRLGFVLVPTAGMPSQSLALVRSVAKAQGKYSAVRPGE